MYRKRDHMVGWAVRPGSIRVAHVIGIIQANTYNRNTETIRIWNADTGSAVGKPLGGHTHDVCSVACSSNGRQIIPGSGDMTIRIWDVETSSPVDKPLEGHTHSVVSVAYSPNGRHIISGSLENKIRT